MPSINGNISESVNTDCSVVAWSYGGEATLSCYSAMGPHTIDICSGSYAVLTDEASWSFSKLDGDCDALDWTLWPEDPQCDGSNVSWTIQFDSHWLSDTVTAHYGDDSMSVRHEFSDGFHHEGCKLSFDAKQGDSDSMIEASLPGMLIGLVVVMLLSLGFVAFYTLCRQHQRSTDRLESDVERGQGQSTANLSARLVAQQRQSSWCDRLLCRVGFSTTQRII